MSTGPALILASGSMIRRRLLAQWGLRFTVLPAHIDESGQDSPRERASRLARQKALAVAGKNPRALVIGSDQVGFTDQAELQKPRDEKEAADQLMMMSGGWHTFFSAAALVSGKNVLAEVHEEARVHFRAFSHAEAKRHVALGEWRGSCGGYQLENRGALLVQEVEGPLSAVWGMPAFPLLQALRAAGAMDGVN